MLKARNLVKEFGPVRVLDDVSLELNPSEVHALLGENGAGKSTLMKLLSGYLPPTAGELELNGQSVTFKRSRDAEAQGVVLIHQEINLADDLTVEENIFLGIEAHRGPFVRGREMRERAAAVLQELETPIDPRRRVKTLSVSQKQMVEIAKAVVRDVRVLLMDEPTDVLTGRETEVLFALIRRLTSQGVAVAYISHKLGEVAAIADVVSVLRDGKRITTQPTRELTQDEMATLMVGRELSDMYPPKRAPGTEVVFAAENVSVHGWAENVSFELRRGEVLAPVLTQANFHWVFALQHEGLSTPRVYAECDRLRAGESVPAPEPSGALMAALRSGDVDELAPHLHNDLEDAAISLMPRLREVLDTGMEAGACGATVCGSGPTVAFQFATRAASCSATLLKGRLSMRSTRTSPKWVSLVKKVAMGR